MKCELEYPIPDGMEIDAENSTSKRIVLKHKEKQLPTKWEECEPLCAAYYINTAEIYALHVTSMHKDAYKDCVKSKALIKAMQILPELIAIRDEFNDGWVPNWNDSVIKWSITLYHNRLATDAPDYRCCLFAFKTSALRNKFLKEQKDKLEIVKPLLGAV